MRAIHPLTLGMEAGPMRRTLGPTAWAALEVLASRTAGDAVAASADASVRDIACELGIAKNTAHRAVQKLVAAALVSPDQRRQRDGRFLAGRYQLTIPRDVLQLVCNDTPVAEPAPRPAARASRSRAGVGTQLDLLADGN